MITLFLAALVAFPKLLVEFLHQAIEDVVGILSFDVGNDVGPPDLDVRGPGVVVILPAILILLQSYVDPDDTLVVAKEDGKLFTNHILHGCREIHMDALHDDLRAQFVIGMVCHSAVDTDRRDWWPTSERESRK